MSRRYVDFVRDWAAKNKLSYMCAATKPALKMAYRKKYPTKKTLKVMQGVETLGMLEEDFDAAPRRRRRVRGSPTRSHTRRLRSWF